MPQLRRGEYAREQVLQQVQVCASFDAFNEALGEKEKAAKEAEHQRKHMEDMQKEIEKIREIMDRFAPSESMDRLFDED